METSISTTDPLAAQIQQITALIGQVDQEVIATQLLLQGPQYDPQHPDLILTQQITVPTQVITRSGNALPITDREWITSDPTIAVVSSEGLVSRIPLTTGRVVTIYFKGRVQDPVYGICEVIGQITYNVPQLSPTAIPLNPADVVNG